MLLKNTLKHMSTEIPHKSLDLTTTGCTFNL